MLEICTASEQAYEKYKNSLPTVRERFAIHAGNHVARIHFAVKWKNNLVYVLSQFIDKDE